MSFRYGSGINKPGFNALDSQTSTTSTTYYLYTWGNNAQGQLGLNNTTVYSSPKQVGSLTDWLEIAGGGYNSLSVKTDGTLWSWGNNASGQLGDGTTTSRSSPVQVGALTAWSKVNTSSNRAFAIKTDGTLWGWGSNGNGNIGDGTVIDRSSPVQIGALTNWLQVAAGDYGTYAIKTDGTMWSWGNGNIGVLGLNNTTSYSSPKQIGALTTWASLAQGNSIHQLAIKTDGTLWAWGFNFDGQLGQGTKGGGSSGVSSPVQVGSLTTWASSSMGAYSSYAITTGGELYSWGDNDFGQLGLGSLGTNIDRSSPVQVGALTTWSIISGANQNAYGITTGGAFWGWGRNLSGQLGQNNTTNQSSPVQVGSLTNWDAVDGGGSVIALLS
jgi:hypothetical protein